MRLFLLPCLALVSHAATLTLNPPVIYSCNGTYGRATVQWKGATGNVQVLVGPSRVAFTGIEGTSGSAETGAWVGEGLEFRLVNQQGVVEALAVAHVRCNAGAIPGNGIVGDSYFPLEIGNTWVYRTDSRFATSDYVIWSVTGLQQFGTHTYSEITATMGTNSVVVSQLREEADGTIWRFTGTATDPKEVLYLNPGAARHGPFQNALGAYPEAASQTASAGLQREDQVFVRGVGLARSRTDLLSGSSGGFASSLELVEFRLATGPKVEVSTPRVSVAAESKTLDVTGRKVTNCAIPCYYAACGLGSPVDPPNTFKPCARTRIEANAQGDFWADLTLLNASGNALFRTPMLPGSGEFVRYVQVPLYFGT